MTYTFELIYINSSPIFFDDVAGQEYQDFIEDIIENLKGQNLLELDKHYITMNVSQYPDGTWAQTTKVYGFKTQSAIATFMKYYGESDAPMRLKRSEWNKLNKITGELNILDEGGDIVQIHTSCHIGYCNNKSDGCDKKSTRRCFDAASDVIQERQGKVYHITPV